MESNVKKLLLLLFFLPNLALSETIATCENPQGYAYFPFSGNVPVADSGRSEEHTSELQSRRNLVCRLLLEKKNNNKMVSEEKLT